MESTTAFEIGRTIGPIVIAVILGISLVGYSIGLWKYAHTRHAGWLATVVVLSLPLFGFVVLLFLAGGFALIHKADRTAAAAPNRKEAVDLLNQKFGTLEGTQFDYTVQVPDLPAWKIDTKVGDFDKVFSHRDLYFGIIAERVGMGDTETLREFVEQNLADHSTSHSIGKARTVTISGLPWKTFDVDATVEKMRLRYRYYIYSDSKRSLQLLAWSSPGLFSQNEFLIDQVASSFRLGQD